MNARKNIFIGTAGWAIRREQQVLFASGANLLARYSALLNGVEINTSFYRPHRPTTYAKWASIVPPGFRFAVKMPRTITHDARLVGAEEPLERFLGECAALGDALGPILIQLPPSLHFDSAIASAFFKMLRARFGGLVALEPRHESWFASGAEKLLVKFEIARVAADPIPSKVADVAASLPGGWRGLAYYRLHGSPKIYYSNYEMDRLRALARDLREQAKAGRIVWCIFDNTALGHATQNAVDLKSMLGPHAR
jgi:uncharacterized protein YecE (DUF72 family)